MTVDYIVSSLPALAFGQPAPMSWDGFVALCGDKAGDVEAMLGGGEWADLETQLRNAAAQARAGDGFARPARGCSIYWRDRVAACFQEKDVLRRDEMIDRVWWDAAGELSPAASPLGMGALAAYAVRLKIALRRDMISKDKGNEAFDRLTAETKK
jgi:hypothetical protein